MSQLQLFHPRQKILQAVTETRSLCKKVKLINIPPHQLPYTSLEQIFEVCAEKDLPFSQLLSNTLQIPFLALETLDIRQIPLYLTTESIFKQYLFIPLWERSHQLYIGIADPLNTEVLDKIQFLTEKAVEIILVEKQKLIKLRDQLLKNPERLLQSTAIQNHSLKIDSDTAYQKKDFSLVQYVDQLLQNAIDQGVSDIHFEPRPKKLTIRFRIDGHLVVQPSPPTELIERVLARIKVISNLDIAEKRLPQDGRFVLDIGETKRTIDCRVSTCPTLHGEKIVVRLLDNQQQSLEIETLGLVTKQRILLLEALQKKQGMILVTGPTGAGKTLTLYSALHYLNQESLNITSVEDPVEINLPGINQINVHYQIGLDYSAALKMFLRQDPDIIMLGEIRDSKTANIAIQAAQTGHLVLSTLHTNSAVQTLTRLINMEISLYNIATSVTLIIAQRLVKRLCIHCKRPSRLSMNALKKLKLKENESFSVFQAIGCKQCIHGYRGRTGIFELFPISRVVTDQILQKKSIADIQITAEQEGMLSLQMCAIQKLKAGLVDFSEIDQFLL